jgi:hypothetical protein
MNLTTDRLDDEVIWVEKSREKSGSGARESGFSDGARPAPPGFEVLRHGDIAGRRSSASVDLCGAHAGECCRAGSLVTR